MNSRPKTFEATEISVAEQTNFNPASTRYFAGVRMYNYWVLWIKFVEFCVVNSLFILLYYFS